MNSRIPYRIIGGLLILLFLFGCTPSAQLSNPTLTFTKGKVAYSGPMTISPIFKLSLIFPEKNPLASGYALVTLKSGKTIADLKAWTSTDPPDWLNDVDDQGYLIQSGIFNYNLTNMAGWQPGEPVYLVCFQMDSRGVINIIGNYGPITVK